MRLILVSCHSANAGPRLIEYPRSISSSEWSVRAVPSFTEPCRFELPDTKASASTKLVLPLAPCPTTAMLRISDPLYSLIASTPFSSEGLRQSADARGVVEPRAQGVVVDRVVERGEVHLYSSGAAACDVDRGENEGVALEDGAPQFPRVVGEFADGRLRAWCGAPARQIGHAMRGPGPWETGGRRGVSQEGKADAGSRPSLPNAWTEIEYFFSRLATGNRRL